MRPQRPRCRLGQRGVDRTSRRGGRLRSCRLGVDVDKTLDYWRGHVDRPRRCAIATSARPDRAGLDRLRRRTPALVAAAWPDATVTCIDMSPPMWRAVARFERHASRSSRTTSASRAGRRPVRRDRLVARPPRGSTRARRRSTPRSRAGSARRRDRQPRHRRQPDRALHDRWRDEMGAHDDPSDILATRRASSPAIGAAGLVDVAHRSGGAWRSSGPAAVATVARRRRAERSGRPSEQLLGERVGEPLSVPLGLPAPVDDEQPVQVGRHQRVDEVRSVALAQSRRERAGRGERAGDPSLALVALLVDRRRGARRQRCRCRPRRRGRGTRRSCAR